MTEQTPRIRSFSTSDGYPIHTALWTAAVEVPRAHIVVVHGVQSHGGWYHGLGRTLASAGYDVSFPDRRGSGANQGDRGHAPSGRRLVLDLLEWIEAVRADRPGIPVVAAGISWGAKLVVVAAARKPATIDAIALICPGLHPRVGVPLRERIQIAWAFFTNRRALFPIPLSDPALFTDSPEGQAFIAADPLSLHHGTAGLLVSSFFIDRMVARAPAKIKQPALLMLAGHDRIVDNARTLAFFEKFATTDRQLIEYPNGHHTLEFDPDPSRYALDLVRWIEGRFADK
jgi:alpha-beta hydrolase superfamily lysophospholipase